MTTKLPRRHPARVLCVDDNEFVRDALRIMLRTCPDLKWAGELANADDLVEIAVLTDADLVILDLDMPGADACAEMKRLARDCPEIRSIVYTGFVRDDLMERVFDCGAWGFISKSAGIPSTIDALRRVQAGEVVIGAELVQDQQPRD